MKPIYLIICATALAFASCHKTELSSPLSEDGTVEDTFYQSGQHGSSFGVAYAFTSKGVAPVLGGGDTKICPRWTVIFECQHGKFVIEGEYDENKHLWEKLKKGDSVKIQYQEKYSVKDGQKKLIGYHFIDAVKVQ